MGRTLLLALWLGLIGYVPSAGASFLSAELTVNGLTCPFCAFGIEKKLLDVPGVREVDVFLDEGRIALTFQPGSEATVNDLEQAVAKAGFELEALSLESSGEIQRGQGLHLVSHPGMTFRLFETLDGRQISLSEETLQHLYEIKLPTGAIVVVEGIVTDRDSSEPSLVIRRIESARGSGE